MKLLSTIAVPFLCSLLLIGCTTLSENSIPGISPGSPANPQGPTGSRMRAVPDLREDAITRATSSRLDRETPGPPEISTPMDHGSMKMDHGTMAPDKMDHSTGTPAAADSYTCTMHPKVHQPTPGNCPLCGMKLVKEKPPAHAQ